ncbi:MAG: tetratricopeptide repeat protein [Candidatus Omnitrophica bacterium]|nr:tetratricopeptide repeat protein [Candidatus Omnitrophota bacterium]
MSDTIQKSVPLNVMFRFRKLIATFVILGAFFSYYNIFLLDSTLENLKFSLEQTAEAYDIENANGLDIILSQATTKEVVPAKINVFDIGNLEYAKNIVDTGKNFNQLKSMTLALLTVIKEKEKQRGFVLTMLDRINHPLRKGVFNLAYLPRSAFKPKLANAQTVDEAMSPAFLGKIREIETETDLEQAVLGYEKLASEYAESDKIALIKLRLAYTYQRLGKYDEAKGLYKEIVKRYYPAREAKIAIVVLGNLKENYSLIEEANDLIMQSETVSANDIETRQEILYKVGIIYTKLLDLEEARKFFRRTISADPLSEIAVKSQFNIAWILKEQHKTEESLAEFSHLIATKADNNLILSSRYQVADIMHSEGKYQESIDALLKLADDYKNESVAALALYQAGASYMYDLNDETKAKEIFAKLTRLYPNSSYSKYLAPEKSAMGTFITYVIPRATRVILWRVAGLYTLSGLSGELAKAEAVFKEPGLNVAVNDWCVEEFPDTIGDIYYDMKGVEIELTEKGVSMSGNITFGRWSLRANGEFKLELTKTDGIRVVVTKAYLSKIPIAPILLNSALTKTTLLINKYFPVIITDIKAKDGELSISGYGSKRILERIKTSTKNRLAAETTVENIKDHDEERRIYALFKERFPASDFTPIPRYDTEELFQDFFTRMYLYLGFKLMETVKDSKLDYQRSIRTLGRLTLVEDRFRVNYTQEEINGSINKFISNEFPWLMNKKFLFDVIGLQLHFKNNGEIKFESNLGLGYSQKFPMEPVRVNVNGTFILEIDKKSMLPMLIFSDVSLNGEYYPREKLNTVTLNTFNLLKDAHIPLKMEEMKVYEGGIILKGRAPRDYSARIFNDPYLFAIFHVRDWDLGMAGIERMKEPLSRDYELYRGATWEKSGYDFGRVKE